MELGPAFHNDPRHSMELINRARLHFPAIIIDDFRPLIEGAIQDVFGHTACQGEDRAHLE
jgi:hypothetical protein